MRPFIMIRLEDVTGISGTGVVAEGVEFLNGKVVIQWIVGDHQSTVVWDNIEDVKAIHGHGGSTEVVFYKDDVVFDYSTRRWENRDE